LLIFFRLFLFLFVGLLNRLSRKSRTGRATPDVMASDEQEGTRHGFSNSSNFNNCSDAFINSHNKNNNTNSNNSSTNGNTQGFLSSFSHLSGALSGNTLFDMIFLFLF